MKTFVIEKPFRFGFYVCLAYCGICGLIQQEITFTGISCTFIIAMAYHGFTLFFVALGYLNSPYIPDYEDTLTLTELQSAASLIDSCDIEHSLDKDIFNYINEQNKEGSADSEKI